jgi:hypothetical protein
MRAGLSLATVQLGLIVLGIGTAQVAYAETNLFSALTGIRYVAPTNSIELLQVRSLIFGLPVMVIFIP